MDILTIAKFRKYLDELEANWTEDHAKYFGKFEDQAIMVDTYAKTNNSQRLFNYAGVTHSKPIYDSTLGIIIEPIVSPLV